MSFVGESIRITKSARGIELTQKSKTIPYMEWFIPLLKED
jgi:hypothetical protein